MAARYFATSHIDLDLALQLRILKRSGLGKGAQTAFFRSLF